MTIVSSFRVFILERLRFLGRQVLLWIGLNIIAALFSSGVEFAIAGFLQLFLKNLGLVNEVRLPFGIQVASDFTTLQLGIGLAMIGICRGFGQFWVSQCNVIVGELAHNRFPKLLVARIFLTPNPPSASEVSLRLAEVNVKSAGAVSSTAYFIAAFVQITVVGLMMFSLAPKEASFGLVGLFLTGFLVVKCNRLVSRAASRVVGDQDAISKIIQRVLRNWLLVTILRTKEREMDHLNQSVDKYSNNSIAAGRWTNLSAVMSPTFGIFILVSIIIFHGTAQGASGLAFMSFLYLFVRFAQDAGNTARYAGFMSSSLVYLKLLFKDWQKLKDYGVNFSSSLKPSQYLEEQKTPHVNLPGFAPEFKIQNIGFTYSGTHHRVLNIEDVKIPAGSQIGIMGESGSGKSTLLLLLLGLLKPELGSINVSQFTPEEFFAKYGHTVGYVGPDPFIIEGSVRDNVNYGATHPADDETINELLKQVKIYDTIAKRSEKLDTHLSDEGVGLSAGQKQRLSLVRALARRPTLLILDEATANLDEVTEQEIANVLLKLKGKMTSIIVSHRRGILANADAVIYLSEGRCKVIS